MFENLKALLIKESHEKKAAAAFYIENGYMPTWNEMQRVFSDNGLKRYSTEKKWNAYQENKIPREKAIECATPPAWRDIEKGLHRDIEKLESAAAVPDIETVSIRVEWKKSRTWGYNPTATVIINQANRYTGSASGCGYDKRTAAIAEALNQSAVILKMLYQAKEKALESGYIPKKAGSSPESNRECIAYGAGYGTLPYFEGGVGMSSFVSVFAACGMKCAVRDETLRGTDYYYFEKVEK